jgi:hypothetical protein
MVREISIEHWFMERKVCSQRKKFKNSSPLCSILVVGANRRQKTTEAFVKEQDDNTDDRDRENNNKDHSVTEVEAEEGNAPGTVHLGTVTLPLLQQFYLLHHKNHMGRYILLY